MFNSFGNIFRLTSFGESHGTAIGGVIDGCPPGIVIDMDFIQQEMARRRPGQSHLTSQRNESDTVQFLSGIYNGQTTGAPIGFIIPNDNPQPDDYEDIATVYRPSHADYTWQCKYGLRDPRGGGRSSARETAVRCLAGAIAKIALRSTNITIQAFTSQIGNIQLPGQYTDYDLSLTDNNPVRCPDPNTAARMESLIADTRNKGDSIGGIVTCVVKGVPPGLGEPTFGKLHAALAHAMLTINAAKGFDYGDGFDAPLYTGSQHNDSFCNNNGQIATRTNYSGGIQGGITNGNDIYFRVAFKATPTIAIAQQTVTTRGEPVTFTAHGRHDPCIVPRAVPIVEAMTALTVFDYLLLQQARLPRSS